MQKNRKLGYLLGTSIKEIGLECKMPILSWTYALEDAFMNWGKKEEGINYQSGTISGYLYGIRPWPEMDEQDCVDIVINALEYEIQLISAKCPKSIEDIQLEDRINQVKKSVKPKIQEVYLTYTKTLSEDRFSKTVDRFSKLLTIDELRVLILQMDPSMSNILIRNLNALTSLSDSDIAFWKVIHTFDDRHIQKVTHKIQKCEVAFQAKDLHKQLLSKELLQWLAIRNQGRSTIKKSPEAMAELLEQKIAEMDWDDDRYYTSVMTAILHIEEEDVPQYALYRKKELDLLLLFKYCLDEEQKAAVLNDYAE